jgi:hypothetical protein
MRHSIEQMNGVADSLTAALATLSQNSETVVGLLDQTLADVTTHQAIGETLRDSAAALADLASDPVPGDSRVADIVEELQTAFFKTYTMSRERDIHARIFRSSAANIPEAAIPARPDAAEAALEDMLF